MIVRLVWCFVVTLCSAVVCGGIARVVVISFGLFGYVIIAWWLICNFDF